MMKVYAETSFFSACGSKRTGPKSMGWRASSLEWWRSERRYFDLYVSTEVIRELSASEFPHSAEALEMLKGLTILRPDEDVIDVAELLVDQKVMPGPAVAGDALHVALAVVHGMDYLLTWNVKHLANPSKRLHFGAICMRLGLTMPQLVTTDLLKGSDTHE